MVREHIIHKTKKMTCGHEQTFTSPVPQPGDMVNCYKCGRYSKIPPKPKYRPWTIAEGRPRRLKKNPKSNNQHTKGRKLND